MTLDPAGASSYCPVDHEVAAEYNGCGDEDRCDAQENDVGNIFAFPFDGTDNPVLKLSVEIDR